MYQMGKSELNAVRRVIEKRVFFRYGGTETVAFEKEWDGAERWRTIKT